MGGTQVLFPRDSDLLAISRRPVSRWFVAYIVELWHRQAINWFASSFLLIIGGNIRFLYICITLTTPKTFSMQSFAACRLRALTGVARHAPSSVITSK
jgi:hypothetical protein